MSVRVKLSEIVDALETVSDTRGAYLSRTTGAVVTLSDDELRGAELASEASDEDQCGLDAPPEARDVLDSSDYLELPSSFDIHEYSIMQDFCSSIPAGDLREELLTAIRGRGAFRCFRDTLRRHDVLDEWHRFRTGALVDIAVRWLEDNGIGYVADVPVSSGAPPN